MLFRTTNISLTSNTLGLKKVDNSPISQHFALIDIEIPR